MNKIFDLTRKISNELTLYKLLSNNIKKNLIFKKIVSLKFFKQISF